MLPEVGSTSFPKIVRKVRLKALRRVLLAQPPELGQSGSSLGAVQDLLKVVASTHRALLLDALGEVDVLTPLLCLEAGQGNASELLGDAIPALLVALCFRKAISSGLVWDGPVHRVRDPTRNRVVELTPPARALYVDRGVVELQLTDGSRVDVASLSTHQPLFPVRPGLELSLHDSNPLAGIELHPDKDGNAVDLGDRPPQDWVAMLDQALGVIQETLPGWHAELPQALRRVVPVGYQSQMHLSASYREALGLCYLTLHPSCLTMAEAMVHETQHGKMNALSYLDPILYNAFTEWSPSPVRPDLRPLWGVLLAVHAFVPVSVLHARLAAKNHPLSLEPSFARRRTEVLQGNLRGMQVLRKSAKPTSIGERVLRDMERVLQVLRESHSDPLPESDRLPPG